MSEDPKPSWNREVLRLAEAIVNDEASVEQVDRLDAILLDDESARSLYLDYIDVHAGLRRRYLSPEADDDGSPTIGSDDHGPTPSARPVAYLGAYWLPAIAATLAVVLLYPGSEDRSGVSDASGVDPAATGAVALSEHDPSMNGVAVLSRLVDVEWSEDAPSYDEGMPVPAGLLSIDSGVVQVEFYCGAVAVLEGPARLELVSAEEAALRAGKLRARVPTRARGFEITTASGTIVDLGTEFAVEAPTEGEPGELHVIDGEVRYEPLPESKVASVSLRSGEAVWLGEDGVRPPPARGHARFLGPTEVETLTRENSTARRRVWESHREGLLSDPDLIALYGYSSEPEWSRLFRNWAPNGGDDTHGSVVGAEWVEGRWDGHKALRFANASHRVSISLPGEHGSLTLATWVALDRMHASNRVALMHPELSQDCALFWTLDRVPTGALLHFAETSKPTDLADRQHYSSKRLVVVNEDRGAWMHFATVYDSQEQRVRHFSNGKLANSIPLERVKPLSIGEADLGNWPYRGWAKGTEFENRNLMGRMDEFIVVGRALSAKEIERMHLAGMP